LAVVLAVTGAESSVAAASPVVIAMVDRLIWSGRSRN